MMPECDFVDFRADAAAGLRLMYPLIAAMLMPSAQFCPRWQTSARHSLASSPPACSTSRRLFQGSRRLRKRRSENVGYMANTKKPWCQGLQSGCYSDRANAAEIFSGKRKCGTYPAGMSHELARRRGSLTGGD